MHFQPSERGPRLARCKPEDQIFGGSLMGIRDEVQQRVKSPRSDAFAGKYGKQTWVFDFRYPLTTFIEILYDGAELIVSTLPADEDPIEFLGHSISNTFARSPAGQMAVAMVKDKNPIDLLAVGTRVYNSRLLYGQRTFTRHSDRSATMHVRGDPLPPSYYVGTLANTFALSGYAPSITVKPQSLSDCDFTVDWDGKPPVVAT